ncbi:putative ABC transport system permease protein [Anaerobranca californiensis DSM 14826]|jgi:putative ABC transport system permease protein|uniref:Putative ABC transport system permease protein n=1 Tax=Anaerobranca californiensis DSM 14826 TaxID=1120989 RepID=A0A1M6QEE4_9FIRM|nr:iron export ABC transporter permease subunit FetB [Anaerobranca californiensis]SHK18684.1 putative ABC transport system permease protein [Anaerobranca californiensis DSM 14826]
MDGIIELQLWRMVAAYIFVVILLFIVKLRGISREKEILISSIRMTLQLILVGYILVYIFNNINIFASIIAIIIMELFAIHNIYKRTNRKLSKALKNIIALSMLLGTLSTLIYFLIIVVNIYPPYDPRYSIPIAGMLIGNSMTGISLGVKTLIDKMYSEKHLVEGALMLGATPKVSTKEIIDSAFDSAILPTINSMVGMGIIFLPGMMTGQILSGISPVTAVKYQIAIMLGILGSVSLTVILFVQLGYKTFFNEESQLIIDEDKMGED